MSEQLELFDVTIIGGGPAGMYTAFYSGMRDLKTKLIEASDELGGRVLIYPEKMIWDVGGLTPTLGSRLIEQLVQQAKTFDPTIVLGQYITSYERQPDNTFILTSAAGERHWTRTVVLAIGYGILQLAKLEIEGADRFEVSNLHYTVQELEIFRGKRVLISGGGDSAVDWANAIEPLATELTVVHRRDQFGGHERNVAKMKASSANVLTPYAVESLHSSNGADIDKVAICHTESGEQQTIEVDAVIVNHGLRYNFGPIKEWGLDMGDWNANVSSKMETNIPGIFAAGDFVKHDSKIHLIAGTFPDAVNALNSAKLYIDPAADKVAYVSSHNAKFKEKNRQLGVAVDDSEH
ncbi:NAD(P)/FAD-dependent oxidoreductase [Paenibacillus sp. NEAU-GSW1]|uniref:NAD(P)/FAD-dependent oxidoreductase n=1 Tax=Paenibacillus sp. NEAU-GSW1 TaxID=2682486 RepID=UPI0012E26924|nr:NAD(P)/FAD-dependent oxidoreductase [Paenibacillus sp. NEAU-GSW1]MUT67929.1 NAD(P)-binding protein [Paenibacillus sp. NEAU-GSW1]